jgi:hypothetical protein
MAKYEPLKSFLSGRVEGEVPMTFHEIEKVIGGSLPPVAYKHRAWWSNNPSNSVITRAWLEAGFRTERVDMGSRKLVFRRAERPSAPDGWGIVERLQGRLAGTVTFAPDFDLTDPTGETWDAER